MQVNHGLQTLSPVINVTVVGTGGFLSTGMEYVHELNPGAKVFSIRPRAKLRKLRHL